MAGAHCRWMTRRGLLSLILVWRPSIREAAFGVSTSVTSWLHVFISVWLLRRRMGGRIGARALIASFARTIVASAIAGVVAWLLLRWVGGFHLARLGRTGMRAVQVFVPLSGAIIAYVAAAWGMRMPEVRWLISRHGKAVAKASAAGTATAARPDQSSSRDMPGGE